MKLQRIFMQLGSSMQLLPSFTIFIWRHIYAMVQSILFPAVAGRQLFLPNKFS